MKFTLKHSLLALCFLLVLPIVAQNKKVNGQVFDDNNEPAIGATIMVVDMNTGVITDNNGRFEIDVKAQDKIEVRYLGYISQTITIGSQTFLKINLQRESIEIDEVVVVGYGTQKKANLTGSVATVDYAKEALSRPIVSAPSALAGKFPGVSVMQASGQPGSEGVTTRIRGYGTLNATAPLVIVDGTETSITAVNPDDIETITVLKDAAACAIYGSHAAANGVILITTKKGTPGKATILYSSLFSYNTPSNLYKVVSDYSDYMEFMNESADNVNSAHTFSQAMIDLWREKGKDPNGISESGYPNYVAYPNVDWVSALFRNAWLQKHSLQVSGASDKTSCLFSASFIDNPGIIEGTGSKKYQLRANITAQIKDWLQVGTRIWGYSQETESNQLQNIFDYISRSCPGIYPYYDGKYGNIENPEQNNTARNNIFFLNRTGGYYKNFYTNADLFTKITLGDFTYNASFAYLRSSSQDKFNVNATPGWSFRTNEITYPGYLLENLEVRMNYSGTYKWTFSNNLRWDKKIGIHDVSAMAGYESSYQHWDNTNISKTGLTDDAITEMSSATEMKYITGTQSDDAYQSFFGRATYAYDDRYLFEMNMRYDASAKFGRKKRWGLFPSFSAGWRVTEEEFMKDVPLDNLKLRISYGTLGNNTCPIYAYQATYATKSLNYPLGGSLNSAIAQTAIANEYLHWETTRSTNMGIDLGVLSNRLTAEIDVYHRVTSDVLYAAPIYATLGEKSPPTQNLCGVTNKGAEIILTWQDKIGDFKYSVSVNGSRNYNQVSKYKGKLQEGWIENQDGTRTWQTNIGNVTTAIGGERRLMEGRIINEFYLLNVYSGNGSYFNGDGSVNVNGGPEDGMIRSEQDMQWLQAMVANGYSFHPNYTIGSPANKSGIYYGDYIYADANGDGIYGNDYDRTFQDKSLMPKFFYGFQMEMAWKGFDLSMNWMGAGGSAIYWRYLGLNSFSTRDGFSLPYESAYDHYFYDPENPNDPRTNLVSKNARLTKNYDTSQHRVASTLWLYDSDFLKLKNLTIGYSLPKKWLKKINFSSVRLFASGENLLTITNFPGLDPEMQTATGNYYVSMRQFSFGLNVNL